VQALKGKRSTPKVAIGGMQRGDLNSMKALNDGLSMQPKQTEPKSLVEPNQDNQQEDSARSDISKYTTDFIENNTLVYAVWFDFDGLLYKASRLVCVLRQERERERERGEGSEIRLYACHRYSSFR
jgi:hypothetical protein